MYQNTPKVPGTPTDNTKNRRLPIPKELEPLVGIEGLGVLVQGATATGTFIVTTAIKQSLPLVAEEGFLALRLKEYVGVAPVWLPVENVWLAGFGFEAVVEEESKACVVRGPILRRTICVSYRTRDSVTTMVVFSTQSPKIGAQDVITYTEAVVRVILVEEDLVGGREDAVVEVTVAGDSVVQYEEEFEHNGDEWSAIDLTVEFA
jgi:hypothetical protein